MSVYVALYGLLSPLVQDNKAYADFVPLSTQAPYLRYAQIGGRVSNTNCHTTSARRGSMPLVQIDVHGKTAAQRDALLASIDAAIENCRNQGLKLRLQTTHHPVFSYDEDTKTYLAVLTYQATSF